MSRLKEALAGLVLTGLASAGCGDFKPFGFGFSGQVDVLPKTPMAGTQIPTPPERAGAPTLTATPRVEATATATATPSNAAAQPLDRELKPGECFQAPSNSVVQGDVTVNGVRYYDNAAKTGLIVQLGNGGKVCAPWGADVILGVDPAVLNAVVGQAVEEMKANGCDPKPVPGCDSVNVVKLPSGRP